MSFISRISLRTKMGLLVILGLLALLGLFGFLGMEALRESVETTLQERLVLAQVAAEHIDRHIEEALSQLEIVAASRALDLQDDDLEPEKGLLRDTFAQIQAFAHLILLLDHNGTVLWTESYQSTLVGSNLIHQPHIQEVLQTGRPSVSGLVSLDTAEEPAPHLAVPVQNAEGRTTGLIDVAIDIAHPSIGGFIQSIRAGETGYVQIVDENGVVIGGTRREHLFKQSHHSDLFVPMIRDKQARVARYVVAEEGIQKREIIAFTSLSQASWGLSVEQEEGEALVLAYRLQRRLLLSGAISLVVALMLVWMTTRSVLEPVQMLTTAAQRIAAGDLTTTIPPMGEDEIGVLARTFEAMRGKLRVSYEQIERSTQELEDRVEHRTRELSALLEITRILASTLDLDTVLDAVVIQAVALLEPADAGALYLYEESLERLVVRSAFRFELKYLSRMELKPGEGVPGQVFASAEAMLFATPEETAAGMKTLRPENRSCLERAMMDSSRPQSVICAPLTSRNRSAGSFLLESYRATQPFAGSDLRLLEAMADQIAIAIENARLLKEADEARALQEADRLKSEFISTISHELRTPLASIKGYATTLLREDAQWDQATQREFLEIIDEESDKLRGLIDNLLEMSKMEAGVLDIEKQPVRIVPIVQQSVAKFASRTDRHTFTTRSLDPFPMVKADPRRLEQVLDNLIENAVKYSPDGGQIMIQGVVNEKEAIVSISDEGVGIPPEHLDRVFDRFYQVSTPLTRRVGGSGLGLSIARWLVEAQGGRIWAESTPGRGSTFFFTLPLLQAGEVPHEENADSGCRR
ncbi:MAG: ATP-binding protein [Anaerolineae bacterium]